jgi:hypothetical protein
MPRLPPPPTIARHAGTPEVPRPGTSEGAAQSSEDIARAHAELPDAVIDLPDAWLADLPEVPPPQPLAAHQRPSDRSTIDGPPSPARAAALVPRFVPPPLPGTAASREDGDRDGDRIEALSLDELDAASAADEGAPTLAGSTTAATIDGLATPGDGPRDGVPRAAAAPADGGTADDAPTLARSEAPELAPARAAAAVADARPGPDAPVPTSPLAGDRRKHLVIGTALAVVGVLAIVIRCVGTTPPAVDASTARTTTADDRSATAASEIDDRALAMRASPRDEEPSDASPRDGAASDASPSEAAPRDGAASDGAASDTAPREGAASDAAASDTAASDAAASDAAPRDGAPSDAGATAAASPEAAPGDTGTDAAPTAAAAPPDDDDPIAIVDDAPPPAKAPSKSSRSDALPASKPAPDANATPEEHLALARAAWKAGNARDTYKYANKSRYKQSTDEANELATLAACKMKLDEAAKSSYKQLDGERKKRTRNACRDYGVRVGL